MINLFSDAACTDGMCSDPAPLFDATDPGPGSRDGSAATALAQPLLSEIVQTFMQSHGSIDAAAIV